MTDTQPLTWLYAQELQEEGREPIPASLLYRKLAALLINRLEKAAIPVAYSEYKTATDGKQYRSVTIALGVLLQNDLCPPISTETTEAQ